MSRVRRCQSLQVCDRKYISLVSGRGPQYSGNSRASSRIRWSGKSEEKKLRAQAPDIENIRGPKHIKNMCLEMFSVYPVSLCKLLTCRVSVREGFEPSVAFWTTEL